METMAVFIFIGLCCYLAWRITDTLAERWIERRHPRNCDEPFVDYRTGIPFDRCCLRPGHAGPHKPSTPDSPGVKAVK